MNEQILAVGSAASSPVCYEDLSACASISNSKAEVSNHLTVLDDPLLFGALPFKNHFSPDSIRWSLGSHDIAFKNKPLSIFFALGQTLPTHRLSYSQYGGLFQPTMTQAIRLLSRRPFHSATPFTPQNDPAVPETDPFSAAELTYTTNNTDDHPAPSAYLSRRHSWVHVFPEGKIHQHPELTMRYFKWGVSRLILESEPCPDLVPLFIEGFQGIMPEERGWPRPMPRLGAHVHVTFGSKVDVEKRFGDLRKRWRDLVHREKLTNLDATECSLGECPESLKTDPEAVRLREECTMRVREEVLLVRALRGWGNEDPKARLVDTWRAEGDPREGRMEDGSIVKEGPT